MKHTNQTLPALAAWYSGKFGVEVKLDAQARTEHTDGQSVTVPLIDFEALEKDQSYSKSQIELAREAVIGWLAHGCMHVRSTDFNCLHTLTIPEYKFRWVNVLEDARIEKQAVKIWPGTLSTLTALSEYFLLKGLYPATPDKDVGHTVFQYGIYFVQSAVAGHEVLRPYAEVFRKKIVQQLGEAFAQRLDNILLKTDVTKSTTDVVMVVEELFQLFEENKPEPEQQPNPQPDPQSEPESKPDPDPDAENQGDDESQNQDDQNQDQSDDESNQDDENQTGNESSDGGKGNDEGDGENEDDGDDTQNQQGSGNDGQEGDEDNQSQPDQPNNGGGQSQNGQDSQSDDDNQNQSQASNGAGSGDNQSGSANQDQTDDEDANQTLQSLFSSDPFKEESAFEELSADFKNMVVNSGSYGLMTFDPQGEDVVSWKIANTRVVNEMKAASNVLSQRLRALVESNNRVGSRLSHAAKHIDKGRIYRTAAKDYKVFRKEDDKVTPNTAVTLLLDLSMSMYDSIGEAIKACLMMCYALKPIKGVKTNVVSFQGMRNRAKVQNVLDFEDDINQKVGNFFNIEVDGGTPLAEGLMVAGPKLTSRKENKKIMFVITDGEPNHMELAKRELERLEKAGVLLVGLAIGPKNSEVDVAVRQMFRRSMLIERIEDLGPTLLALMKGQLLN